MLAIGAWRFDTEHREFMLTEQRIFQRDYSNVIETIIDLPEQASQPSRLFIDCLSCEGFYHRSLEESDVAPYLRFPVPDYKLAEGRHHVKHRKYFAFVYLIPALGMGEYSSVDDIKWRIQRKYFFYRAHRRFLQ